MHRRPDARPSAPRRQARSVAGLVPEQTHARVRANTSRTRGRQRPATGRALVRHASPLCHIWSRQGTRRGNGQPKRGPIWSSNSDSLVDVQDDMLHFIAHPGSTSVKIPAPLFAPSGWGGHTARSTGQRSSPGQRAEDTTASGGRTGTSDEQQHRDGSAFPS